MDNLEKPVFRGRINRRLSLIFGLLFLLVLVVGGASLYLVRTIMVTSKEIAKDSERVHLVESIHSTIHHFFSALLRAALQDKTLSDSDRKSYLYELDALLQRYREIGGTDPETIKEIQTIVADVVALSERIAAQTPRSAKLPGRAINPQELSVLRDAEQKIQAFAHRESIAHRIHEKEHVLESQRKMGIVNGIYVAFVLGGGLFILGMSVFFQHTIAQPLRWLAQSASDVAQENLQKKVPVTSTDEIGELSHAFNLMVDRLKEHEERLRVLATMEERERVAQELHDSLAQDLAVLHIKLIEAEGNLSPDGDTAIKETLAEVRKTADRAFEDVRQAIFGLHTMVSKGLGFVPTLTEYLHDFSELRKIPVDLKVDSLGTTRFSPQVEVQLIRIIHEALTNVFKHAQATRSTVKFERDGDFARVTIEDNGKGFVMEEVMRRGLHFGLQTMRKRAEGVRGRFSVETAVGKGTRVIVYLPLEEGAYEAYSSPPGR